MRPQTSRERIITLAGILWLCAQPSPVRAGENGIAGDYDRLIVGQQQRSITALFSDCTGECKFSCTVFFTGEFSPTRFPISAHVPGTAETIAGEALVSEKKLRIRLAEVPAGCWNVEPDFKGRGVEFLRNAPESWQQIRLAREPAVLFARPNGAVISRFAPNDALIVLQDRGAWLEVRKPAGDARRGWVRANQLHAIPTGQRRAQ